MIDLVIELRRADRGFYSPDRLRQFAADEIERLQLIIQRCHGAAAHVLEDGNMPADGFIQALQHIVNMTAHSAGQCESVARAGYVSHLLQHGESR